MLSISHASSLLIQTPTALSSRVFSFVVCRLCDSQRLAKGLWSKWRVRLAKESQAGGHARQRRRTGGETRRLWKEITDRFISSQRFCSSCSRPKITFGGHCEERITRRLRQDSRQQRQQRRREGVARRGSRWNWSRCHGSYSRRRVVLPKGQQRFWGITTPRQIGP